MRSGRPTGAELEHLFHQDKIVVRAGTNLSDRTRLASCRRISPYPSDEPNDPPLRGHATAFFGRWSVDDPLVGSSAGAVDLGYRVIVVRDAVCSSSDQGHDALITLFRQRYTEQIEVADAAVIMERWES